MEVRILLSMLILALLKLEGVTCRLPSLHLYTLGLGHANF
jgi:hypothetical protein